METETESEPASAYFNHKNNIAVGNARVIYALPCHPAGRDPLPEGWSLPGGRRTQSRYDAANTAMVMDALMSGRA